MRRILKEYIRSHRQFIDYMYGYVYIEVYILSMVSCTRTCNFARTHLYGCIYELRYIETR